MRYSLLWTLFTAVALMAAPASAEGHYKGQRYWYIGPHTVNDEGNPTDPLNLFFYPYASSQAVLEDHLTDHWRDEWVPDRQMRCRSSQSVGFKVAGAGFRLNKDDFHGVGKESWRFVCGTRYHMRAWGDYFHEVISNDTHTGSEPWIIAGMHFERVFALNPRRPKAIGHNPDRDWDLVEWFTVTHRSKLRAHSSNYKWRVLPGSKRDYQKKHSDGYITRVSPYRHG